MKYYEFLKIQEKEFKAFSDEYLDYAFDQKQLKKAMQNLKVKIKTELINLGAGCIIKKINLEKYKNLKNKQFKELLKKYEDDDFLFEAFKFELSNHEYIYNQDDEEVLGVLGIRLEALNNNTRINKIYNEARTKYLEEVEA